MALLVSFVGCYRHNDAILEPSTEEKEDKELVARILGGDQEAFSRLVGMYHPRVFRLVRGILGDWHLSEDTCQEIFTLIYRKVSGFQHRSRLSTWIYRVAVNAALKARKRSRSFSTETLENAFRLAAPDDGRRPQMEGDEVVKKLLLPLPEKLRVAVVLREQGGLSYAEMASVLGCSRGAVEQRLHRAMVLLREIWKDDRK